MQLQPRDQGRTNMCTSYAIAAAIEYKLSLSTYIDPSSIDSTPATGEFIEDALKHVMYVGCYCSPKCKCLSLGKRKVYKIKGYKTIQISHAPIIEAINNNDPIIVSLPCWSKTLDFYKKIDGITQSSHCVLITGITTSAGYVIRNSWGTNWGSKGYGILSFADIGLIQAAYILFI